MKPLISILRGDIFRSIVLALTLYSSARTLAQSVESNIRVQETAGQVKVTWPISPSQTGTAVFNLDEQKPLIESLGTAEKTIIGGLNPVTLLTVGSRDSKNPQGWGAFFDNAPLRPFDTYAVQLGSRHVKVTPQGTRTTISLAEASAETFKGDLRFTFFQNSPLIEVDTVVKTDADWRAIVYDAGLVTTGATWKSMAWNDTNGTLQRVTMNAQAPATPLAVSGRTIVAEAETGSLALFPAPHQFFYPQDEAFNLRFVWYGRNYLEKIDAFGFGIRQSLSGDKRYVPWFNAPPGTDQHLRAFYLIDGGNAAQVLEKVAAYTHGDRFKKVPGYLTFTSHYHIEHCKEYLAKQKEQKTEGIPAGLELPGFVKTFKARGVNIAHLAEYHYEDGSRIPEADRLRKLKLMHDETRRLSDNELLVLPGEEPNVQIGGHWVSLFPKPVYWTLNRPPEKPFVEEVDGYGRVYHVGSPIDVLRLFENERGLFWTAHPRIKASFGFPDKYKDTDFYRADCFLGAAWKAMPADLSRQTLGWRVLDLLDDSSNWGARKQAIGEVDIFRMDPDFETYAHMNINYLSLDKLPKYDDGWQPVLDTLRAGKFFTTTGEILIPKFSIGGMQSGQTLDLTTAPDAELEVQMEWTFPLAFAAIVSGDSEKIYRQRLDLSDTNEFGTRTLNVSVDLKDRTWARFEVWDIAANGAFTQPIWIKRAKPIVKVAEPSTFARFVPERADDFAWENDLAAFRVYGPAIRPAGQPFKAGMEDSGIDVWTKRVPYPVIDKWYSGEKKGISYHQDHGEGCDLYKVGSSRGCGGTAIWKDGRMIIAGPYKTWKVVSQTKAKSVFELTYDYNVDGESIRETKTITLDLGKRLFQSVSKFTNREQPLTIDVAIGVTTHDGAAKVTLNREKGWMACWEQIEGSGLGTGVAMAPSRILEMKDFLTPGTKESHALIIARTDAEGKVEHYAGFGWERAGTMTDSAKWNDYLESFASNLK